VKYPREIRLVDAIPLTSVMKPDRKLLRAMLTAGRPRLAASQPLNQGMRPATVSVMLNKTERAGTPPPWRLFSPGLLTGWCASSWLACARPGGATQIQGRETADVES
jgi:hypothetical protein